MKIVTVLILSAMFFMAGCAGTNTTKTTKTTAKDGTPVEVVESTPESPLGRSDYAMHTDMYKAFKDAQATLMDKCNSSVDPGASDVAQVSARMSEQSCKQQVANMRFDQTAPETIVGMFKSLGMQVPLVWAVDRLGHLGEVAAKNGGSTYGPNATLTNSGNRSEANPVVAGQNNSASASATGTSPAQVVTTEKVVPAQVVYPEVVKVP